MGDFTVRKISIYPSTAGEKYFEIEFFGKSTVKGSYQYHEGVISAVYFTPDKDNLSKLPNIKDVDNEQFFYLDARNSKRAAEARKALGDSGIATITINNLIYIRQPKEAVNSAELVRVVSKSSGVQRLSLESLKNSEFIWQGKTEKLTDGIFYLKTLEGKGGEVPLDESQKDYYVMLDQNHIIYGDLNNDGKEDAASFLISQVGGTGVWRALIVFVNQNGKPKSINGASQGDRTEINSFTLKDGIITIERTPKGSSIKETIKYKLSGDKLFQI